MKLENDMWCRATLENYNKLLSLGYDNTHTFNEIYNNEYYEISDVFCIRDDKFIWNANRNYFKSENEIVFEEEKFNLEDVISKDFILIKSKYGKNRTHYIKYIIKNSDNDLSLRYYFSFEDRPYLENVWIIKSHKQKEYIIVTTKQVEYLFKEKFVNKYTEIIGSKDRTGYKKKIINNDILEIKKER